MTTDNEIIEDNPDIILVVGDVGIDVIHANPTLWIGAGGTALNLADILCDTFAIQTWLVTRCDPVIGWLTRAAMRRFAELNEGLGSVRTYSLVTSQDIDQVFENYNDLDISTRLAINLGQETRFDYQGGRDIDLTKQMSSLAELIDASVATVIDTRLSADTIGAITSQCHNLSVPLIVMSNARNLSEEKIRVLHDCGGCHLLVLKAKDMQLFKTADPCDAANSQMVAYIRPDQDSWSIHKAGHEEIVRGRIQFDEPEKKRDGLGSIEAFTAGYINAVIFEGWTLEDRRASNDITMAIKQIMMTRGGNKMYLRDPQNPDMTIAGA